MKRSSKIIIAILIIVILAGSGVGAYFLLSNKSSDEGDGGAGYGNMSSRYDGMYYYYISGMQYKSVFIKIKGNKYESSDGDSGIYKVNGTSITFYKSVMGDDEVVLSGTIEDGVISVKQDVMGIEMYVYYCKDGKAPSEAH